MMMKTQVKVGFLAGLMTMASMLSAWGSNTGLCQNREVPGDHFSLEGALELFKLSKSPEEFERLLNSADTKVNNLDLNGDGDIDYVRVIDKNQGRVHAFILQAVISQAEFQDVAVIELEKLGNGKAVLQIVGDEDIYGIETIIEPTEEVRVNAGTSMARTYVNVWAWPSVQYVYDPFYAGWVSPWGWYSRPMWWSPWRPVAYVVYRPYWDPYRNFYSACHTHRVVYARDMYRPYRTTSVIVRDRHHREISYARETRGRDSYYDQRDNGSRTRSPFEDRSVRTSTQSRTSTSGSRDGSKSSGRTRYEQPASGESRSHVRETPEVRTKQRSTEVNRENQAPRSRVERVDRAPQVRPQSGGRSMETRTRPSSNQRPSVQPRQSLERSAPKVNVQRGGSSSDRSHVGGGSSGSGQKKRGRE